MRKTMNKITIIAVVILAMSFSVFLHTQSNDKADSDNQKTEIKSETKGEVNVDKTEAEWRSELTDEEYRILRQKGTERAGTGEYNFHFEEGEYKCAGCGEVLFGSDTKYESHCGWPSFYDIDDKSKIKEIRDDSHGMVRTEVVCANCGGHLGHVFNDGPAPTGLRYCINSVSLDFEKDSSKK